MAVASFSPFGLTAIALLAGLFPLSASAQTQNASAPDLEPAHAPAKPWSLSFEPTIWRPAIDGGLQLPGGTGRPDYRDFGVDGTHLTGMGYLRFHKNKLMVEASGFDFTFSRNAVAKSALSVGGLSFTSGQSANIDVTFSSAQVIAGWRLISNVLTEADAPVPVSLNLDFYGGIRGYSFDTTISSSASSVSDAGFWVEPIIGVRGSMEIFNKVTLHLSFDGGAQPIGDHTSNSFDITVGARWRPTPRLGIQFGWRQLIVNLNNGGGSDKLELNNGTLAGLYGSLVVRF